LSVTKARLHRSRACSPWSRVVHARSARGTRHALSRGRLVMRGGNNLSPKAVALPSTMGAIVQGDRRRERRLTPGGLVAAIVAALVLLGFVAYFDEERAAEASFADFAAEQVEIAKTAAAVLSAGLEGRHTPVGTIDVLGEAALRLRAIAQRGDVAILVKAPETGSQLLTLDDRSLQVPAITARASTRAGDGTFVRLNHPDAVTLGLPERTAVAGLADIRLPEGRWTLVVATTARRERDREERGLWRVALGFVVASAIVVTFGTLALRIQRAEFELGRRLELAEFARARDDRLGRADKLATLGALATGIVHQVSTPLSVIVVRAERLAIRVVDDDKARRSVAIISEQAHRIHAIIRGFLRLARGGLPTLERVHPGEIAQVAVDLVEHRFEKAGVALRTELEENVQPIACDPRLFEQAIVNLLLNACDACTGGGHVLLRVHATPSAVTFVVEDDGVGITEEAARRATEPFFTTKSVDEGTGLGLAIASEIVNHHYGTLVLEPLPRCGTRASIELPPAEPART